MKYLNHETTMTMNARRWRLPQPANSSGVASTGRVCPDCCLRRSTREFKPGEIEYLNCVNCHGRHGKKR